MKVRLFDRFDNRETVVVYDDVENISAGCVYFTNGDVIEYNHTDTDYEVIQEVKAMAKTSDAHMRAIAKYDAENTIRFGMKLNKKTEGDIIDRLNEVEHKQTYVKRLIRDDIERSKK